jgi:hypothetical protein
MFAPAYFSINGRYKRSISGTELLAINGKYRNLDAALMLTARFARVGTALLSSAPHFTRAHQIDQLTSSS